MKLGVGEWITLGVIAAGLISAFAVMQFQINNHQDAVDKMDEQSIDLALLKSDVKRMRCEIGNVKRLIKSQPERDC